VRNYWTRVRETNDGINLPTTIANNYNDTRAMITKENSYFHSLESKCPITGRDFENITFDIISV